MMSNKASAVWLRRLKVAAVGLLTLVVAIVGLLQLSPVATWLVRRLVHLAPLNPGYSVQVGRVGGTWLDGLVLENVALLRGTREVARIGRLRAGYRVPDLAATPIRIREIDVDGVRATARREGDSWDIANVLRRSSDTTGGGGVEVDLLDVRDGAMVAELSPDSVLRVRGLSMLARELTIGEVVTARIDRLNVAVAPPMSSTWFAVSTRGQAAADLFSFDPVRVQTERSDLAGRVVLPRRLDDTRLLDRLDIRLKASPLSLADIAPLAPAVASSGDLSFDLAASAESGVVNARLVAAVKRGDVDLSGSTRLDRGRPTGYRLHGTVRRLDPSSLASAGPSGLINGTVDADLQGTSPDSGTGTIEAHVTRSVIGTTPIQRLDLHTDLSAGRADIRLRGDARQAALALDGWVRLFDSIPAYRFAGSATRIPGTAATGRALAGAESDSLLDIHLRVAGSGFAPATAHVTGRLDLAALHQGGEPKAFGKATLSLEKGLLAARPELTVGGGRIAALATARFGDTVTYRISSGTIAGVDLGAVMGDTLSAPLNGRFSVSGSGTTPNEASAVADLRLDELRYGGRRIDSVVAGARLERGRAKVGVRGAVQGGRMTADVTGRPFDSTASFTLTRARLDSVDVGTLMGRPDLEGPVTIHGTGRGRWSDALRQVSGELTIEPSRLGHVTVTSGALKAAIAGRRLTYEASVNTNGGALSLAGDGTPLDTAPMFAVRRGRADSLDLGALLGRAGLRSAISATFTARLAGAGDSTDAGLYLAVLPSTVNDASVSGGQVALAMRKQNVTGALGLQGPDGTFGATVGGRLSAAATTLHSSGTVTLEHLAKWTGNRSADGRIEGKFAFDASADSAGLRSVGGSADAFGGVGGVRLFGAKLALTPLNGSVQVDTLRIRSNVGQLDGNGTVALRDGAAPGMLNVGGRLSDIEPLAALFGPDTVSVDSAIVALELSGPARQWKFAGRGNATSLLFGGNLAEAVAVEGRGSVDSTGLSGVRGALDVRDAALGRVIVPKVKVLARYDSLLAIDAAASVGDSIRLATFVRGTVAGDTVRAVVQRLDLDESGRVWSLDRPARVETGPRTRVDKLTLVSGDRRIAVDGVLDLKDSSDVALAIRGLDLDGFRAAGLSPVGGRVDGDFHLVGRADDPTLQGKVGLAIVGTDGKTAGRIGADVLWRRIGLQLNAVAAPTAGGRLTIAGTVPYRLTLAPADTSANVGIERGEVDTLGIAIRADSFNLSLFQPLLPPDVATDLTGRLAADGHVGGRLGAPETRGTFGLTDAALTLPALGVSYQEGELAGRLDGDELRIDRLRLLTGKKQVLDGRGVVHLKPLTDPGLDLDATLTDFLISDSPTLRTSASGKIALSGTVNVPSVTGALDLGPTDVFVGAAAAAGKVEPVDLTAEDLRKLSRDFGPSVLLENVKEQPGLMDRVRMDIALRLPRRVWIRKTKSPEANIELSGNMRLKQEPGGDMQFVGKVEPIPGRGSLDLSGRTFRLTGGEINLDGPVDSTRLDVTAEYQVPTQGGGEDNGILITVAAKGRLDSLGLDFSSDPTMSQEDVLSYIVTGHPASDNPLESSGGQGFSGKQMAFGQLSQALSGSAGRQLGFDVFQIKTDPATGLSLTAGRYLSSRFFLNLKLPLGSGSSSTSGPGQNLGPGFELEYSARRWLRANLRGGSLPPAILFRGRHAY